MNIYNNLPVEIQNKIKYMVLEHPTAKIIKDEIERLRCDEYYKFKDNYGCVFCKVYGRDFFSSEYFRKFKKKKDRNKCVLESDGIIGYENVDSDTSDEYVDEVFNRLFFVSNSSSSDDEN